jgi:hypothetical protein
VREYCKEKTSSGVGVLKKRLFHFCVHFVLNYTLVLPIRDKAYNFHESVACGTLIKHTFRIVAVFSMSLKSKECHDGTQRMPKPVIADGFSSLPPERSRDFSSIFDSIYQSLDAGYQTSPQMRTLRGSVTHNGISFRSSALHNSTVNAMPTTTYE